jgi:hypothetical protein
MGHYKKAIFSLRLIKHRHNRVLKEEEVELHSFLTSASDGGESSGSQHSHFTPQKVSYDNHL